MSMRKSPLRHIVYPLQGALAWSGYGLLKLLPVEISSALGGAITRTIGPLLPVSKVAERNIAKTMPELSPEKRQRIVREVWENLGRVVGEFPHLRKLSHVAGRVELSGEHHFANASKEGKPAIFFSGHFANWEVFAVCAREVNKSLSLVYRHANNPYVDKLYRFARRDITRSLFPKNRVGAKALIKALRDGDSVGMLIDQKMNDGVAIPFFGFPAMTAPAIAELALKQNIPIYPGRVQRVKGTHFKMEIFPKLSITPTGSHAEDVTALLTRLNQQLEEWIRDDPGQWLWLHRRWGKHF